MNLYHVSQKENTDYDTYSDFVVAAKNEEEARNTSPDGETMTQEDWAREYSCWASSPSKVKVELIGKASKGVEKGVICSSFHAG